VTRFLIVGLGGIGQRHLRNLRALLGVEAEIIAYRTRGLTQVLSDRLHVESEEGLHEAYDVRVFTDLDEALATQPIAVFICNPSSFHLPVALRAAAAGCNLFIEKPLSHTYEGVSELLACVERQDLVALVGYQWRFHRGLLQVRELLRQQAIGRVLAARAEVGEYLPNWHTYEDYRQIYAARRDLGGGVVLSQIHEMDYLYWFFGLPKRVFCIGGHLSHLEIDAEDVASTLMEFESDGHTFPVHLHQDYVQRPPSRSCHIIGDEGKIEMDLLAGIVRVFHAGGAVARVHDFSGQERNQLFLDELKHFLACLRREQAPAVSVGDGAASLRMALAAKQSLETGQLVELH
jgi:predicted dehydrogenase